MPWKKTLLNECKLYLILDAEVCSYEQLFEILKIVIPSGVNIVQLRDKRGSSKDILNFTQKAMDIIGGRVPFIMNDRIDLALVSHSSGVHLGQDDVSISAARAMMGSDKIIGASCQTLEQAKLAQEQGADYIGFGSVFNTLTKPDRLPMDLNLLADVAKGINIPVFAIGGIGLDNVEGLSEYGVERVAVCRAVCQAEHVRTVTQSFRTILNNFNTERAQY